MAELPKILMLFANPKDDLTAIRKEMDDIVDILRFAKHKKICDYDAPFEDKPLEKIIEYTSGAAGYSASIFHFSGHANEQQLLLTEDAASVNAICNMLKLIRTKFVFLNGCCTKGFLEKLFANTDVIAAIATYNKVKDKDAAKLSAMFYTQFFMEGLEMETIFKNLCTRFEKTALTDIAVNMREVNLPTSSFPDENKEAFQWGLFYKDPSYFKITIGNLLGKGPSPLAELDKKLNTIKANLLTATEELKELEPLRTSRIGLKLYNDKTAEIDKLKDTINQLKNDRVNLDTRLQDKEKALIAQRDYDNFSNAIKQINYYKQAEIYAEYLSPDADKYACLAATGDENSVLELLLMRMEEEYGFIDNNHKPISIDYTSNGGPEFWSSLATHFIESKPQTPEEIAITLIDDLYFGSGMATQQHIILKVNISPVPIETISSLVCDFWTCLHNAWPKTTACKEGKTKRHKMIMLLIDDMSTQQRHDALEALTDKVNAKLQTKLQPMGWIEPLKKEAIENWIDNHSLYKVGIKKTMANDIFKESENGKIRKVLESIHKRCSIKNLQLFYTLKITQEKDDIQSLLRQIGG